MRTVNLVVDLILSFIAMGVCSSPRFVRADESAEVERYETSALGLRFAAPYGWSLSRHTGYPGVLCILTRADLPEAQILLSLTDKSRPVAIDKLIREDNRAMRAVGFQIITSGQTSRLGSKLWQTQAQARRGKSIFELRQLYWARTSGDILILTASAPTPSLPIVLRDVDLLLESLQAER